MSQLIQTQLYRAYNGGGGHRWIDSGGATPTAGHTSATQYIAFTASVASTASYTEHFPDGTTAAISNQAVGAGVYVGSFAMSNLTVSGGMILAYEKPSMPNGGALQ